jgi:uncharacterized protein (TIGR02680 family)
MTATRFHPVRAGIVNLWHYPHLELPFADGRLVLRGSNGSGKTKALELLFPLVLDGSLDPRRLDPFSSDGRRMRDNVLAAAEAGGHRSAIGYAWITFGRTTEAGAPEHVTVGIGVSGSHERDRVDSWTFVTDRVPGVDLHLLDDERRPVSRPALRQLLGGEQVFDTVEAHRRAVDARLFGLGEARYHGMLELVLQLRKPKLAALLDPDRISLLLSQSLRPIDGEALDDVARGLAELERIGDEIAAMDRTVRALDVLHRDHATYLRAHARSRLDALQRAEDALADLDRLLLDNAAELADATARASDAERAEQVERDEATRADGEIGGLKASDAYRAGGTLADRRQAVANRRSAVDQAARRMRDAQERCGRTRKRLDEANQELAAVLRAIADGSQRLRTIAPDAVGPLDIDLSGPSTDVQIAIRAATAARREAVDAVRQALRAWEAASVRTDEAAKAASQASTKEQEARGGHQAALVRIDAERRASALAAQGWAERHAVVTPEDHQAVAGRLLDGERDDVASLAAQVRQRWEPRKLELVSDEQRAASALAEAARSLEDLRQQRDRVAAAEEDAPPDSPWRTASRDGRAGAPLWRLVDFAPHLEPADRAGLEGALLAAGLLDAWVDPPGVVRPIAADDAFLRPGEPVEGPTLADVLVPEARDDVPPAHVLAILHSVGVGRVEGLTVTVDPTGRFRLGPLSGALRCDRARYVGATAREAERVRRIAELDDAIVVADCEAEARRGALRQIQTAKVALDAAVHDLPDVRALVRALDEATRRQQALDHAVDVRREAEATLNARTREQSDADVQRRRTAASRGLPDDRAGLDAAAGRLASFEKDAASHVSKLEQRPPAERRRADAEAHDADATQNARQAASDHDDLRARLVEEEAELAAIEASLGAAYRDVVGRIHAAEERASTARKAADQHHGRAVGARNEAARLEGARPQLEARRAEAVATQALAVATVEALLHPAFALVLGLQTPTDVARLAEACADVSATEQQLKRVETNLQTRFHDLQRDGGTRLRSTLTSQEGLLVVEVDEEGREPSAVYASRLARRLTEHRALLADKERAIFEDQLLGTLCTSLFQRLRAARAFAREADDELQRRPLSSGVRFGLQWKARQELAPHESVLLDVLRRDADHLGPGDLDAVRRALREALAHLRTEMPGADHRALLDTALDYRRWHRFAVSLHRGAGQPPQELTRHRHAQLSGGEKAAALYAPLFAAARATFAGGYPTAPRLVALDEAFEGIDPHGRPELLAVTVAFDLDLLLTGYDLWLADATVPAAMHAQLHNDPASKLAIAELIHWDGVALEDVVAPVHVQVAG